MTTYKAGQILFSGSEEHLDNAKKYIQDNNFTQEEVRIVRNYRGINGIDVVAKKEITK